jgi:hypothetical protein
MCIEMVRKTKKLCSSKISHQRQSNSAQEVTVTLVTNSSIFQGTVIVFWISTIIIHYKKILTQFLCGLRNPTSVPYHLIAHYLGAVFRA